MIINDILGLPANTTFLIIHADDAGLCHAENRATKAALEFGLVNSTSVMVPCPWFEEMAAYFLEHPEVDFGVHLTLTSEWKHFRWGPLTSHNHVSSLITDKGYFYANRYDFKSKAKIDEIKIELKAQIEKVLYYGLKPTHLDSHMYTMCMSDALLQLYIDLGKEYKLPVLLSEELMESVGFNVAKSNYGDQLFVNNIYVAHYDRFHIDGHAAYYTEVISNLKPGLNAILIHPAYDDREMKAVAVNHPNFGAEWRQQDFNFFTNDITKELLSNQGINMITWREIGSYLYK
jgi:chitin disaccharide deacetylase